MKLTKYLNVNTVRSCRSENMMQKLFQQCEDYHCGYFASGKY